MRKKYYWCQQENLDEYTGYIRNTRYSHVESQKKRITKKSPNPTWSSLLPLTQSTERGTAERAMSARNTPFRSRMSGTSGRIARTAHPRAPPDYTAPAVSTERSRPHAQSV